RGRQPALDELEACQPRHLNIQEYQIDRIAVQDPDRFKGIITCRDEVQEGHLADIVLEQFERKFLVIYGYAAKHQCKLSLSDTENHPFSRSISKVCLFRYNRFNRLFTLVRPMPEVLSFSQSIVSLKRFRTQKSSRPSSIFSRTSMRASCTSPVPCLKAFSTKGISSMGSIKKPSVMGWKSAWMRTCLPKRWLCSSI